MLVTKSHFNTKVTEIDNKTPVIAYFATKLHLDTKLSDIVNTLIDKNQFNALFNQIYFFRRYILLKFWKHITSFRKRKITFHYEKIVNINCYFGAVKWNRSAIKRKFIWNHYRIAFNVSFYEVVVMDFLKILGFLLPQIVLRKLKMFITTFMYLVHIDNIDNIDDS